MKIRKSDFERKASDKNVQIFGVKVQMQVTRKLENHAWSKNTVEFTLPQNKIYFNIKIPSLRENNIF